jgi:hypothetical protein
MATFTTRHYDQHTHKLILDWRELDAHDTYSVAMCNADRSKVTITCVGTSEMARCERGHRWMQSFRDGWIEVPRWTGNFCLTFENHPAISHRHGADYRYQDRAGQYCVAPERCDGAAHGNITRVEECDCSAHRQVEINGQHRTNGDWVEDRQ